MSTYATRPRPQMREKLKLQNGQPITIALEFQTGKRVSSQYGRDEVYYTLTDGREWYADLEAAEMVEKLDLVAREPFTICRLGAGRYEVQRAGHYPTAPMASGARPLLGSHTPSEQSQRQVGGSGPANSNYPENTPTKLENALKTAVLAAANAEKYAAEIGYTVRFDAEAIKCMAITVLINMEGGRK